MRRAKLRRLPLNLTALAVFAVTLFPVYWMAVTAFKPTADITAETPVFLPTDLTLAHFRTAVGADGFAQFWRNSLLVTVSAVLLSLLVALGAAFAVARMRWRGRRACACPATPPSPRAAARSRHPRGHPREQHRDTPHKAPHQGGTTVTRTPRRATRLRTPSALLAAAGLLATGAVIAPSAVGSESSDDSGSAADGSPAAAGPALFDDFDYTDHNDARLGQRGWTVRSGSGGPGAPGVGWAPEQVTFPGDGAGSVLNLRTSTDGTAAGTRQTELYHQRKFQQGTYAARVHFSDAPASGPDGDQMVQTFFTITPLDAPMDPDYGELDFEYLPNGGWGEPSNTLFATSWETYRPDPWEAVNTHTETRQSYAGWHDLVITVDGDSVDYYVDGQPFAVHNEPYLPETPMSINLNHWIISGGLAGSTTPRAYDQQVDYVYFAKDQTLTPAQVAEQVAAYRAAGVSHEDTVPGG